MNVDFLSSPLKDNPRCNFSLTTCTCMIKSRFSSVAGNFVNAVYQATKAIDKAQKTH